MRQCRNCQLAADQLLCRSLIRIYIGAVPCCVACRAPKVLATLATGCFLVDVADQRDLKPGFSRAHRPKRGPSASQKSDRAVSSSSGSSVRSVDHYPSLSGGQQHSSADPGVASRRAYSFGQRAAKEAQCVVRNRPGIQGVSGHHLQLPFEIGLGQPLR